MPRNLLTSLILGCSFEIVMQTARAHHSENEQYDSEKTLKLQGMIKRVESQHPHVCYYVDVKDESGKITTWGFSGAPPGSLMRRGVTKDALNIGAVVNVE